MKPRVPSTTIVIGSEFKRLATLEARRRGRVRDTIPQAVLFFFAMVVPGYIYWIDNLDTTSPSGIYSRIVTVGVPFATLAVVMLLEAFRIACLGQTPGMKSNKIEIIRYTNGTRPTLPRACIRAGLPIVGTVCITTLAYYLAPSSSPWVAILTFLLVHLSCCWHPERRGWPDRLSGLVVVAKDDSQ